MRISSIAALVAMLVPAAAMPAPLRSGIYSSVKHIPEADDLVGNEIELHLDSPKTWAEFVMCEGWCNSTYRVDLVRTGESFSFDFDQPLYNPDGKAAPSLHFYVTGRMRGNRLLLTFNGERDSEDRLKLVKRAYGLGVARIEQAGR
ncbi:hypothetical protein [Sphingomonas montanisoli]|uniref:MH2 domain-containing protein n=1 Tax=Sphingomonas montanisoli TaxID=2606412 RepID=A0A5D9CD61_9SPHN|nr:hypothetical protein [Sphingomonas montanisoli]TZG28045.1 hypothetical protein FYJ91_10990 [Sphingomonas montanisoli]